MSHIQPRTVAQLDFENCLQGLRVFLACEHAQASNALPIAKIFDIQLV